MRVGFEELERAHAEGVGLIRVCGLFYPRRDDVFVPRFVVLNQQICGVVAVVRVEGQCADAWIPRAS